MPLQYVIFPFLLVFYEIGAYLSNDMYLPALPTIMTEMGITQHEAQLTLTLWFLGSASMQLIVGPLADRFGRRPIVMISGVIYIITNCICASTTDLTMLLIARFIQGVSVSAVIVAGYASIHELYDQTRAIRLLATMNSITILAPAFGPLVGSFLLKFMDWRWLFWIIAVWAVIATLCLAKWMPESLAREKRHPIQLKTISKSYFAIFTNWRFTMLMLSFGFTFCGFIAWLTAGPFIVVDEFHKTALEFGIFQTIVFAFYMSANHGVKKLMRLISIPKLIYLGLLITLLGGIISIVLTKLFPDFLLGLIIGMSIFSLGSGFSFAPLNRIGIEASKEPMGMRMAVASTYMTVFGVFGSILGSVFYTGSMVSLAYVLVLVSILAPIFKLLAGPEAKPDPAHATLQK